MWNMRAKPTSVQNTNIKRDQMFHSTRKEEKRKIKKNEIKKAFIVCYPVSSFISALSLSNIRFYQIEAICFRLPCQWLLKCIFAFGFPFRAFQVQYQSFFVFFFDFTLWKWHVGCVCYSMKIFDAWKHLGENSMKIVSSSYIKFGCLLTGSE